MRANALKMEAAVAFVATHPGSGMAAVTAHLLEGLSRDKPRVYKQAASVVERIIKDRLVRQDASLRLYPWDAKRKAYAEALERAAFAAPDPWRFRSTIALAADAWRHAGDENRARTLEQLRAERERAG